MFLYIPRTENSPPRIVTNSPFLIALIYVFKIVKKKLRGES